MFALNWMEMELCVCFVSSLFSLPFSSSSCLEHTGWPPTRTICVRGCFLLFCFCFFVDPIYFLVSSFWSKRGAGGVGLLRRDVALLYVAAADGIFVPDFNRRSCGCCFYHAAPPQNHHNYVHSSQVRRPRLYIFYATSTVVLSVTTFCVSFSFLLPQCWSIVPLHH